MEEDDQTQENRASPRSFWQSNRVMLLTLPGAALCSIPIGLILQAIYLPSWELPLPLPLVLVAIAVLMPVSAVSSYFVVHPRKTSEETSFAPAWLVVFNFLVFVGATGVSLFGLILCAVFPFLRNLN